MMPRLLLRAVLLACAAAPAGAMPVCRRPGDVGRALAACWTPPAGGGTVTLALALRRDGTVLGRPRVTFLRPGDGGDAAALVAGLAAAVRRCAPFALSPALREVLPGQILRVRLTATPAGVTASTIWSGT